jgi:hypothetical protein
MWWASLLGISLPYKILAVTAVCVGLTGWGFLKGYQTGSSEYRLNLAQDRVVTMTKIVEVTKLDQTTLQNALLKQRKQLEKDFAHEPLVTTYINTHPTTTDTKCGLDDDGLRLWNDENRGVPN